MSRRGEQVDRVPEAAVDEHAVEHGERRHRDAAGDAARDARGVRVDRDRQPRAVARLARLQVRDARAATARDRRGAGSTRHRARRARAAAPRGTSRRRPHERATTPTTVTSDVRHQARRSSSVIAERGDHRPRRRRGNLDRRSRRSRLRHRSASHHVDDDEHDDPHRVDEVPVPREHLGALRVRRASRARAAPSTSTSAEQREPDGHVRARAGRRASRRWCRRGWSRIVSPCSVDQPRPLARR